MDHLGETLENVDDAVFMSSVLEAQPNKVTIRKDWRDFDVNTPHIGGDALRDAELNPVELFDG